MDIKTITTALNAPIGAEITDGDKSYVLLDNTQDNSLKLLPLEYVMGRAKVLEGQKLIDGNYIFSECQKINYLTNQVKTLKQGLKQAGFTEKKLNKAVEKLESMIGGILTDFINEVELTVGPKAIQTVAFEFKVTK